MLAALSWFASGALYLTLPPSPDQFNHAYMGWRLVEGDVPYRDFIDQNWPGVIGLHGLTTWIFGVHLWSWRAFDFLLFAASTLFLADLVRIAAGRDAGRLSLVLCPLIYAGASFWVSGQHDMSAAQFLLGALWFHVRGYERKACWWQLGTGFFLGAAMLNKPTVGLLGALLPLQALCLQTPWRSVIQQTATAGAAALATLLAAVCWVLSLGATLSDIIEAVYTLNVYTYASNPSFVEANLLLDSINSVLFAQIRDRVFEGSWWLLLTFACAPAALWIFHRDNRSIATTALPVLWLTGALSYFLQWRGQGYHMAPALITLAGGLAISAMLVSTKQGIIGSAGWKRAVGAGLIILALAGIGIKLAATYYSLPMALLAGDYGRHLSRFKANNESTLNVADVVTFVNRLEELPPANECMLVMGTMSSINYLSKRRQPTRFYYFPVLVNATPPLPMAEHWIDLWERELKAVECRFVLLADGIRAEWLPGSSRAAAALRGLMEQYRESGTLGAGRGMTVYERR